MSEEYLTIGEYSPKLDSKIKILTGQQFGRWIVIAYAGRVQFTPTGRPRIAWLCQCKCGVWRTIDTDNLTSGRSGSCGCLAREMNVAAKTIHGESHQTPEYEAYANARSRCNNPNNPAYARYGGKGVKFCFESYFEFLEEIGRKPTPEHSVDRYPNKKGNYEKGNIRWATPVQQARNTDSNVLLTIDGVTKCIREWEETMGLTRVVSIRRKLGWCDRCAVMIPVKGGMCPHKA